MYLTFFTSENLYKIIRKHFYCAKIPNSTRLLNFLILLRLSCNKDFKASIYLKNLAAKVFQTLYYTKQAKTQ